MRTAWTAAYWALVATFLTAAFLNLAHVRAGFLTSYLADLTVPAFLYLVSRGLGTRAPKNPLMRWIGRTPERAAAFFFLASCGTEASQVYWPRGVFAGRFDPWDIVAYGIGITACYIADRGAHERDTHSNRRRARIRLSIPK